MALPKKSKVCKKGISFPADDLEDYLKRAASLGFNNFSAYITALAHKDFNTPGGWLSIPPKRAKK